MRAEARECDLGVVEVDVGRAVRGSHSIRDALEVIGLPAIIGVEERDPCRGCLRNATVACCRASRLRLADASQRPAEALEQLGRSVDRRRRPRLRTVPRFGRGRFRWRHEALFPLVRRNDDSDGRCPAVHDLPANSASCCSCIFIQTSFDWSARGTRLRHGLSRCCRQLRPFASCAHDAPGASLLAPDTSMPRRRGLWCVRDSRRSGHAGDWSIPAAAFSLSALSVSSLR